jgi:iduronate 2-sulfatase
VAPGAAVVVVGDPSPDRGAHGLLTRPDALFDDTLRSTLVVATPGLSRPGRTSRRLVSTLDVAPTLLALAGLVPEPALPGLSLVPLLADPGGEGRGEVLSSVERKAGRVGRTARTPRWRYTEWPDGSRELYDHDADPGEIANLASRPEHASTVAGLGRAFETPRPVPAVAPAPTTPAATCPPRRPQHAGRRGARRSRRRPSTGSPRAVSASTGPTCRWRCSPRACRCSPAAPSAPV